MTLEEAIAKIKPLDHNAMEIAQKRWDSIAKPLHSLGKLETLLIQIAGITGNAEVDLSRRGLIAMCADNGACLFCPNIHSTNKDAVLLLPVTRRHINNHNFVIAFIKRLKCIA